MIEVQFRALEKGGKKRHKNRKKKKTILIYIYIYIYPRNNWLWDVFELIDHLKYYSKFTKHTHCNDMSHGSVGAKNYLFIHSQSIGLRIQCFYFYFNVCFRTLCLTSSMNFISNITSHSPQTNGYLQTRKEKKQMKEIRFGSC